MNKDAKITPEQCITEKFGWIMIVPWLFQPLRLRYLNNSSRIGRSMDITWFLSNNHLDFELSPENVCPEELKSIGIKEFIAKPISKQEIGTIIRKVLDKSRVTA